MSTKCNKPCYVIDSYAFFRINYKSTYKSCIASICGVMSSLKSHEQAFKEHMIFINVYISHNSVLIK